jgi:hypothetical protein
MSGTSKATCPQGLEPLEPQEQSRHHGSHGKPLRSISLVLAHVSRGLPPVSQQSIGILARQRRCANLWTSDWRRQARRIGLELLDAARSQAQTPLKGQFSQIHVLSNAPLRYGGDPQLHHFGRRLRQAPLQVNRTAGGIDRRQHGAVAQVPRHPTALHQHRARTARRLACARPWRGFQAQRRQHHKTSPTIHRAVVQVHGVLGQPSAMQLHRALFGLGPISRRTRQGRIPQRRQCLSRHHRLVDGDLLVGTAQLPTPQRHSDRHPHHRCQKHQR